MPRLKKRPSELAGHALKTCIGGWMFANGITMSEAAVMFEMSESTFRRRMKDPESLTFGELRRIAKVCRFTEEQIGKVVKL